MVDVHRTRPGGASVVPFLTGSKSTAEVLFPHLLDPPASLVGPRWSADSAVNIEFRSQKKRPA
jgi:hypothetical protein